MGIQVLVFLLWEYFQIFTIKSFKRESKIRGEKGWMSECMFGMDGSRINALRFYNNSIIIHTTVNF